MLIFFIDFLAMILSHKIFVHLNRLTYGMYMFSPIVMTVTTAFRDTSLHFEEVAMVTKTIAISMEDIKFN